ncbi:MAG: hypothetical protein LUP94_00060 [Candidatus Methanomethylicus sp.]|nr:hypothetical protein [Candidatus Methanomethylicus sp.]
MVVDTRVATVTTAIAVSDERVLYPLVAEFLSNRGFKASTEVFYHGRRSYEIDVVGIKGHQVLAVEVKLKCFSKAFRQAMKRLRHSDYVYMGFPMPYASFAAQEYHRAINKFGLGIIGIGEDKSYEIVQPKHSKQLNSALKERFIRDLKRQVELRKGGEIALCMASAQ